MPTRMHRVSLICLTIGRKLYWIASWYVNIILAHFFYKVALCMFIGVHRSGIALDTPQSWHPKEPEVTFRDSAESFLHLKKNDPLCLNVTIFSPVNHNGKQGHLIEFIHAYQQSTAPPKARGASFIYCCLQRQGKGTSFVKLLSTLRLPCNVTHTHTAETHTHTHLYTHVHTQAQRHTDIHRHRYTGRYTYRHTHP